MNDRTKLIRGCIALVALAVLFFVWHDPDTGDASYYHDSLAGEKTASGEPYNPRALTAAHRDYDLGTRLRVTYLETGKSVVVRVNDRGPFESGRIIDLSKAAARRIGLFSDGVGEVHLEVVE